MLGVSPNTVTRWAREGRLPCQVTLGGHHRFDASSSSSCARASTGPGADRLTSQLSARLACGRAQIALSDPKEQAMDSLGRPGSPRAWSPRWRSSASRRPGRRWRRRRARSRRRRHLGRRPARRVRRDGHVPHLSRGLRRGTHEGPAFPRVPGGHADVAEGMPGLPRGHQGDDGLRGLPRPGQGARGGRRRQDQDPPLRVAMSAKDASETCASCHFRTKHALWAGSQHDQRNVGCTTLPQHPRAEGRASS